MGTAVFRLAEVRPLAEHALAAQKHLPTFGEEKEPDPGPALHFVHDDGIYVMSNGDPRQLVGEGDKQHSRVAYAEGCDPKKNDDWWEESRAIVGGDDFVEKIPIDDNMKRWLFDQTKEVLIIELNGETMDIKVAGPMRRRKVG